MATAERRASAPRNGSTVPETSILSFNKPNPPNAAIVMESVRHVGYSNRAALEDIGDNAIDAGATQIAFRINHKGGDTYPECIIGDNGCAMSLATLDESLKLGSETNHDLRSDLGKFGMGLVTAGHSIARRIRVLTKEAGKPVCISVSDIDEMIRQKDFVKALNQGTPGDLAEFKQRMEELGFDVDDSGTLQGTIIILENCDGWSGINRTVKRFTAERVKSEAALFAEDLGSTFRRFIEAGLRISVNGEPVRPVDQFMLAEGGRVYLDEDLEFDVVESDGKASKEVARIKVGCTPELVDSGVANRQKPSLRNQGFSILRNHREIAFGQTLDVFVKHNAFNRLRAEIEFPAALDDLLGVHFTKQGIEPNQAFLHRLKELTFRVVQQVRRENNRAVKMGEEDTKMHREAEKDIAEKQHLLLLPPGADKEKRGPRKDRSEEPERPEPPNVSVGKRDRRKLSKTQPSSFKSAKFEAANLGDYGPIYQVDKDHGTVVITWNLVHPFYETFVLGNNPRGSKAIDYFVYSLACTELMVQDEQTADFVENMKALVASNMRTLLR